MRRSLPYLIPLFACLGLGVLLFIALGLNPRLISSPLINKPVPAFALTTLESPDRSVTQADMLDGPALINVWASWCVSCRQEHDVMMTLAQLHGVTIYGLNYKDGREQALAYLYQDGNPYAWSAHDQSGRVGIDLGVYGTPETFVIDGRGRIRHKHTGPMTWETAQEEILPLLDRLAREES